MPEEVPSVIWVQRAGGEYARSLENGCVEIFRVIEGAGCRYEYNRLGICHIVCWGEDGITKQCIINSIFRHVFDCDGKVYMHISGCDRYIPCKLNLEAVLKSIRAGAPIFEQMADGTGGSN